MKIKKIILEICLFVVTIISYLYTRFLIDNQTKQQVTNNVAISSTNEIKNDNMLVSNNTTKETKSIENDTLVKIEDYIPNAVIDIKYATTDNFTGVVIYENGDAYLRYGSVKKLINVEKELERRGYKMVVWDAYRPVSAQYKLWEVCPDSLYVANPNNGYSKHSRGNTIDISIVKLDGSKVELPSGYDDFSEKADRDYSDVSSEAKANAEMLEKIMKENGFSGYQAEWWHYTDDVEYEVVK